MFQTSGRPVPDNNLHQRIIFVLFAGLIFLNGIDQIGLFNKSSFYSGYPGLEFTGLRPFLHGVREAGYYGGKVPSDHNLDAHLYFDYQQAQYALSPVLLDNLFPFTHEWLILKDADPADFKARVVARLPNGISLIKKGTAP